METPTIKHPLKSMTIWIQVVVLVMLLLEWLLGFWPVSPTALAVLGSLATIARRFVTVSPVTLSGELVGRPVLILAHIQELLAELQRRMPEVLVSKALEGAQGEAPQVGPGAPVLLQPVPPAGAMDEQ